MISVVIPTYRHASNLPVLVNQLTQFLSRLYDHYEIIIVDDGSQDETESVLYNLCKDYEHLKGIILEDNFGQQHATLAGIRSSVYDLVLTLDDDFNYTFEDITRLLKAVEQDYDLVYLVPKTRDRGLYREWGTRLKEHVFYVFLRKPKSIQLTSIRLIKKPMIEWLCSDESVRVYLSARALQKTQHIGQVISFLPSKQQTSRYTTLRLVSVLWHAVIYYGPLNQLIRFKKKNMFSYDIQYIIKAVYP